MSKLSTQEKKQLNKKTYLSLLAILVCMAGIIAEALSDRGTTAPVRGAPVETEAVAGTAEEAEKTTDKTAESAKETAEEAEEIIDKTAEGAKETAEGMEEASPGEADDRARATGEVTYELLVCVPAEFMSLWQTSGLGKDVTAELKAGTYLEWYGETASANGQEYYKVVVRDTGLEGYVSKRYCVSVEFEPEESDLTIVETDTAIYTYDMMSEDIRTLCDRYPDRLSSRVIGYSVDGRELYEVILGNPSAENHIMLQAGIHGREYMTSQLVMKMIEYYSHYYETAEFEDVAYRDLFEQTALHIVPMSNPDGVTISQLGVGALNHRFFAGLVYACYQRDKESLVYEQDSNKDMHWADYYRAAGFHPAATGHMRKITFEEYQTIWKANARGVDLNNNFDAGWEELQLKEHPAYAGYKGDAPVSEPESAALAELALAHDYRYFISYHSRGQLIYYDAKGNTPETSESSLRFANLLEDWIKYGPVNTTEADSVNLGGFGDWVQLSLNKPSVTIESGKKPCPLGMEEFPAIWHRHRESWAMLARELY